LRVWLQRTTTAESRLAFFARRVSAASPERREDEMPEVGAVQRLGSPDYLVAARRQRIIKMRDSYRQLAEE
jgi:hypothetical protein